MNATLNEDLTCGSDLSIANAARRSFDTEHQVHTEGDTRLIHFLIREGHWLPFRHPQLSFSCEAPVFVARQLGKHQVGMSWSEVSRRYKTTRMRFWYPETFRQAPTGNAKQGTGPSMSVFDQISWGARYNMLVNSCYELYEEAIDEGMAPEQARAMLPQSMLVYWTWTGSLLAWLHLIKERLHPSAQTETRQWVQSSIVPEISRLFPVTWEAIQKYTEEGVRVPNDQETEAQ